MLNNIIASVD